jgi:hypothetical protein
VIVLACLLGGWGLLLLLIYPLQALRLARRGGKSARENWLQAVFLVLGKFPEMLGQVKFLPPPGCRQIGFDRVQVRGP